MSTSFFFFKSLTKLCFCFESCWRQKALFNQDDDWKDAGEGICQLFQLSDSAGQGPGGGSRAWNVLLRKQYLSHSRDEVEGWLWNSQIKYLRMHWITMSRAKEGRKVYPGISWLDSNLSLSSRGLSLRFSTRGQGWALTLSRCAMWTISKAAHRRVHFLQDTDEKQLLQLSCYRSKNRLGQRCFYNPPCER